MRGKPRKAFRKYVGVPSSVFGFTSAPSQETPNSRSNQEIKSQTTNAQVQLPTTSRSLVELPLIDGPRTHGMAKAATKKVLGWDPTASAKASCWLFSWETEKRKTGGKPFWGVGGFMFLLTNAVFPCLAGECQQISGNGTMTPPSCHSVWTQVILRDGVAQVDGPNAVITGIAFLADANGGQMPEPNSAF